MNGRLYAPLVLTLLVLLALTVSHAVAVSAESNDPETIATSLASVATPTTSPHSTVTPMATQVPTSTPTPSPTPTATSTPTVSPTPTETPGPAFALPEAAQTGKAVIIDQSAQMMYAYENGVLVRTMPVSTGRPSHDTFTPTWEGRIGHYVGTFSSFGTTQDEGWYLFQSTGGILIHGAPYIIKDGKKVYQELEALGNYPASHGCIRLAPEDAEWFTAWGPQGAYCLITPLPEAELPKEP